jgi:predicted ATP-binding protein involved in virulence
MMSPMSEYNLKRSGTASEDLELETCSSPSKLQKRPLYSKQQLKIAENAKGPGQQDVSIIRITAAAGTGKTTTLKLLAEVLQTLGHTNISYITFNKTAAEQMKMPFVTSKTIHSWAFLLLNVKEDNAFLLKTDTAFEKAIHNICGKNVLCFLGDMLEESKLDKQRKRRAEKIVTSYLMKTLKKFLQSAKNVKEGFDCKEYENVYYPARLWHEGKLENNQLLPGVPTASSANDKLKVARF